MTGDAHATTLSRTAVVADGAPIQHKLHPDWLQWLQEIAVLTVCIIGYVGVVAITARVYLFAAQHDAAAVAV